jgi:hypothetical protein
VYVYNYGCLDEGRSYIIVSLKLITTGDLIDEDNSGGTLVAIVIVN